MGRGVETIGDNVIHFDATEFNQGCDSYLWDDLVENLQEGLSKVFPSLQAGKFYPGGCYRENFGILENDHVKIYISEYCGAGAISVDTGDAEYPELAEAWVLQVWEHFTKTVSGYTNLLRLIATGSNGIPFYEGFNNG